MHEELVARVLAYTVGRFAAGACAEDIQRALMAQGLAPKVAQAVVQQVALERARSLRAQHRRAGGRSSRPSQHRPRQRRARRPGDGGAQAEQVAVGTLVGVGTLASVVMGATPMIALVAITFGIFRVVQVLLRGAPY